MNLTIILTLALQTGEGPNSLSFLAYLDVWIISGLVLLAVVVVVGKWLWGRMTRRTDDTDGYGDDEEYDPYDDYYEDR